MTKKLAFLSLFFLAAPAFAGSSCVLIQTHTTKAAAAGGGTQADVIQSTKSVVGFASSLRVQLANNGTSGSTLVLYGQSSASGGQTLNTPTGWTLIASTSSNPAGINTYMWYRRNFSVGVTSATLATASSNNAGITGFMVELSNLNASPFNSGSSSVGQGTGVTGSTNVVTSVGNCVVVAGFGPDQGTNTAITANNSFTLLQSYTDGTSYFPGALAILGAGSNLAAGTYTPSFSAANVKWYIAGGAFCQ